MLSFCVNQHFMRPYANFVQLDYEVRIAYYLYSKYVLVKIAWIT